MNTKRIDQIGKEMVDGLMEQIIDELSSKEFYEKFLDKLQEEKIDGLDIEQFNEPSGFMVDKDEIEELSDMLHGNFLQRFYFTKKDTGEE
jgi:hypothetical protein